MLGFNAQHTLLGYYNDEVVVACKDFEIPDKSLFNFGKVKNSVIRSSSTFGDTDLKQILKTIQNQKLIDPNLLREFFGICLQLIPLSQILIDTMATET